MEQTDSSRSASNEPEEVKIPIIGANPNAQIESNEHLFVKFDSKLLKSLDLDSLAVTTISELPHMINGHGCVRLPHDQSIFFYGGEVDYSERTTGEAFIVDKNQNIRQIPSGTPTTAIGLAYHNNFVYALGGNNQAVSSKYNLAAGSWENCAPLPRGDFSESCSTSFQDHIFIVADRLKKLVSYDIRQNCFSEISSLALKSDISKVIFSVDNRLYIIELENKIYQSGVNDFNQWSQVGRNNVESWNLTSLVTKFRENVYFILSYKLIQFNLNEKTLTEVKEI